MPLSINRRFGGERAIARLIVAAALALNAYWLAPELEITRVDLNDNILHYAAASRMADAIEQGENPFDHWVSEWTLGYPLPRTYQPLGSFCLAVLYLALGKTVPLLTLFVWLRFMLLVFFPLTIYCAARLMEFDRLRAAAAALVAPLIASGSQFGLEFSSYVWRGSGLYTQCWAMHLMALTLGFGYRAFSRGRGLSWTGVLLGLTFLFHFIYGYMAALSLVLLAFLHPRAASNFADKPTPARRAARLAWVALTSIVLTASFLIPLWLDAPYINRSRWESPWKWDSVGFVEVVRQVLYGDLLDHGRLPVLTLLLAMGIALWILLRRRPARAMRFGLDQIPLPTLDFAALSALLWLFLYCGRESWGTLFSLLGASEHVQLHRLIGGVHLFAILLCGMALGSLWHWFSRSTKALLLAAAVTILLLLPAWAERSAFLAQGAEWGRQNLEAEQQEHASLEAVLDTVKATPGRTFAGLAGDWGKDFRVGSTPLYGFLATHGKPAVGMLYHAMALTSDITVRFNEWRADHYRLFNVTTVLADASRQAAGFLVPAARQSHFQVYKAPGGGYFDLVQVPFSTSAAGNTLYDITDPWLQSDWVEKRQHIRLDFSEGLLPQLPRLDSPTMLPALPAAQGLGEIRDAQQRGEEYSASARVIQPCYLLFKMTYHPNWRVYVNGERRSTVMLTPGMPGVALDPGEYRIECRYEPEVWRTPLLFAGLAGFLLTLVGERRVLPALENRASATATGWRKLQPALRERIVVVVGLLALALPVCIPLATNQVLLGHDTLEYLPRLVEFHENIRHGILIPRWAPDLSANLGQPFFVFNPPLLYYCAEVWLLMGVSPVAALNLTCALIVIASAAAMFLLGRFWFGACGGWLAAAAYIYAPYFHVDLFVRHALAEFAAFPFYPLAFYGFSRFARGRELRSLLIGAIGYAGVIAAHHPAALLFSPLLLGLVVFESVRKHSWNLLLSQLGGMAFALGLGASVWLPAMFERQYVHLDRLLEGYLLFTNHFVYLQQFFDPAWGYGLSQAGYQDGMSFSLGWSHVLLAAAAWIIARRRPPGRDGTELRQRAGFLIAACLIFCGLMLAGTEWLWQTLPLLKNIEFPWRMLAPASFCLALLVAAAASRAQAAVTAGRGPGLGQWALVTALALLILPNLHHIGPAGYQSLDLRQWTPQQIAARGVSVTTRNEYEPRWAQFPGYRTEAARVVSGSAEGDFRRVSPLLWTGEFKTPGESIFEVSCYYFPGWRAWLDGVEIPLTPAEGSGLIRLMTPPGNHRLELQFTRTRLRAVADTLSLLFGLILIAACVRASRRKRHFSMKSTASEPDLEAKPS